jgi:flagellar motor switch protein FliM
LCGYLADTLLLGLLRESWPAGESAALEVGAREAEFRNTRLFPPAESVFVFTFRVTGPFGEGEWHWLLPRGDWVIRLLDQRQPARPGAVLPDSRAQLTRLAEQFPVRLSVRLGQAEVSLQQLSRLQAGDLILLDQRVGEPLRASLAGAVKFHVWPGAVGSRQAVAIHSLLDEH